MIPEKYIYLPMKKGIRKRYVLGERRYESLNCNHRAKIFRDDSRLFNWKRYNPTESEQKYIMDEMIKRVKLDI